MPTVRERNSAGVSAGVLTVGNNPGFDIPRFTADGIDVGMALYSTGRTKTVEYR